MTTITSVQDGVWTDTATWDSGTVPTSSDFVVIKHLVTIDPTNVTNLYEAMTLDINGGGLVVGDDGNTVSKKTLQAQYFRYTRHIDDDMPLRLDGIKLNLHYYGISSNRPTVTDGFPLTPPLYNNSGIIVEDPGYFSQSATLQDVKPEGCGKAYARKVSNNVRFLTVSLRIPWTYIGYLRSLYRMAEGPFQVLAVTPSCIIKGHIETVAPDSASVGKEYITVKVTIAEGPRA